MSVKVFYNKYESSKQQNQKLAASLMAEPLYSSTIVSIARDSVYNCWIVTYQ